MRFLIVLLALLISSQSLSAQSYGSRQSYSYQRPYYSRPSYQSYQPYYQPYYQSYQPSYRPSYTYPPSPPPVTKISLFEVFKDTAGNWVWELRNSQGETIAQSAKAYPTSEAAAQAAAALKKWADSPIVERPPAKDDGQRLLTPPQK
jgi:uncharacterized protein YegP (UPF0339 family)